MPSHLAPLPGGRWRVWRTVALRGTGFPVERLAPLATPRSARAIDAWLAAGAQGEAGDPRDFEEELAGVWASLWAFFDDPLFREAALWQNRGFVGRAAACKRSKKPNSDERRELRTVAMYAQRYCFKNDTIGFYGPVGWATIGDDGPALEVTPGAGLVASRTAFLETWTIDEVAKALAVRVDRAWLRPRLSPFLDVEGDLLHVPMRGSIPVAPAQAAALRLSDGTRTVHEIAEALSAQPALGVTRAADVLPHLQAAEQLGALSFGFQLPIVANPELALRERLEQCGDDGVRAAALADLDELVARKRAVAGAAGDPQALAGALEALDATFHRITGGDATRRAGQMYAARTVVYEDARRDCAVRIGPDLLTELGPALSIALDGARWFSWHVSLGYLAALRARFDEMAKAGDTVRVIELFNWFRKEYMKDGVLELASAEVEWQRCWADVLALPPGSAPVHRTVDEVRARAQAAFAAPAAGWPTADFAPDLMIAASSVDAIARGEYVAVLGEVHYRNTLRTGTWLTQHPRPEDLVRYTELDHPEPALRAAARDDADSYRATPQLFSRHDYHFDMALRAPSCARDRAIRIGELVARRDDGMIARTRDGRAAFSPEALLGLWLEDACGRAHLATCAPAAHTPRVTIDRLVIARERWQLGAPDLAFIRARTAHATFVEARRLARDRGMPRHVFVKVRGETKPIYLDLESPVLVDCAARMISKQLEKDPGATIVVTEALPTPEQSWLADAQGRRYAAELRVIAPAPGGR